MQLGIEGQCEPCPRGTYRTQGVEAACQGCPSGRTTARMGAATVEECSLPVCTPGSFLNASLNTCITCKKGTYQPASQQTACLPCPPNTSTKTSGAVSSWHAIFKTCFLTSFYNTKLSASSHPTHKVRISVQSSISLLLIAYLSIFFQLTFL